MSNCSAQTLLGECVALDALVLREHTELAGDAFDLTQHRQRLQQTLATAEVCAVRRNKRLVAYATLSVDLAGGFGFVTAFNTHPAHRGAAVMRELLAAVAAAVLRLRVSELRSNVYKTNRPSMAFHRRLGFRVTRENEKGVEFTARVAELLARPVVARAASTAERPAAPIC